MFALLSAVEGFADRDLGRSLRILYAEDMSELRDVVQMSFAREGHDIECVADGVEAIERVVGAPSFDLIITDHHMPNLNGLGFVSRLREMNFAGKIMVFSSEVSPQVIGRYEELRVDRIVCKPVSPSDLRHSLKALFAGSA